VACVVVFTPVAEAGCQSTIGARCLRGAGIILLLRRFYIFATCIAPGTAVDTATGMAILRQFAPMAGIRTRTVSTGRQGVAGTTVSIFRKETDDTNGINI